MPGPEHVYVCPSCRHYVPVDEVDGEPTCATEGCDREGTVMSRLWMCPACERFFESAEDVKEHGAQEHDL